jgi:putative nucleotidyltransferase with HDIG domain
MGRRALVGLQLLLLVAALTGAVLSSRAEDWQPIGLVVLLAIVTIVSDVMSIQTRHLRLSGGFISVVLAMALLGPAPAVAVALSTIIVDTAIRPLPPILLLSNLAAFATYPLVGGLLMRWLNVDAMDNLSFALAVFAVFGVTNLLNFLLIVGPRKVTHGMPLLQQFRTLFVPMLPSEALACVLTVVIAVTYRELGLLALVALIGVLFLFQVLTRELLLSQERAEQLEARTTQLAAVHFGVLKALLQTLSLRDRMTARHSAAVARYSRAIAAELGLPEEDQDRVHTTGLLHDIGKFAFPDRILLANRRLDEEDWKVVRTHPYQGARLVRTIDGYDPVAEIILAHHERIDGKGYPRGLKGEEIPLLARIISVADTYDVMTARDSYRTPVSQAEAIAELRRVSGSQLDAEVVEAFIRVLERTGVQFQHTTDADFLRELNLEARIRGYAIPDEARVAA